MKQQQQAQQQADSDEYDDSDSPTFYSRNQSTAFKDHISVYCRLHASVTSPETFKQLTAEKYLLDGAIHPIAAISLLDSERRIVGQEGEEQGKLSNLQERCVGAIEAT